MRLAILTAALSAFAALASALPIPGHASNVADVLVGRAVADSCPHTPGVLQPRTAITEATTTLPLLTPRSLIINAVKAVSRKKSPKWIPARKPKSGTPPSSPLDNTKNWFGDIWGSPALPQKKKGLLSKLNPFGKRNVISTFVKAVSRKPAE